MNKLNLHLVSDSTGETLIAISKAVLAQFDDIEKNEILWPMIRTPSQMEKVIQGLEENPGVVFYTIVDKEMSGLLTKACREKRLPFFSALESFTSIISLFLNKRSNPQIGKQHELDEDYFLRVEAINYTLAHDDGQNSNDLDEADIILIGVSRTSKTPTCVYLANRGFKVANIPFVKLSHLPEHLEKLNKPLIVGLTLNLDRLIQIRKNRLISMNDHKNNDYIDAELVESEILEAKKLFQRNHWPVIDVTKRSVEETAATIIQFYQARKQKEKN